MTLSNVKLILAREIRDQMRDRRTLFMMFVLPILLYPLLGMSFVQIQQFLKERPVRIWVLGAKRLPEEPPLIDRHRPNRFAADLFARPEDAELLELYFAPDEPRGSGGEPADHVAEAKTLVQEGIYDAALCFPEDFDEKLDRFQESL